MHEPMQSAYKAFHSTESALLRIQNDLLSAMDIKQGSFLVLLDLSAAFDTVDHDILLHRIQTRLGIGGTALTWLRSYLADRTQKVMINDTVSTLVHLPFGVPQGSVLGPLLFSIYTLPIADIIKSHGIEYHLYADDTQLYLSFDLINPPTSSDRIQKLERCLVEIQAWMTKNKLKLNEDKTEIIILSSPFNRQEINVEHIQVGTAAISPALSVRNLGVIFDSHLTMGNHVRRICSTAYYHLRNISSIRKALTHDSVIALVHAFVSCRLDYCNSLLSGISKELLQKLQRVQNMSARMITGTKKHDHITPILKGLHWLPVEQRIKFKLLLFTFKALNGAAPSYIRDLLTIHKGQRQLRSSSGNILVVPKTRLKTAGDRTFIYQAATLWNALPETIRSIKTVATFKCHVKTYLFQLAYSS